MEYRDKVTFDDPKAYKEMIDVIRLIIRQELKNLRFNRMIPAKVTSVGSGVADVELLIDGTPSTIGGLKNKTGEVLNVNDEVYVEVINNKSSNIYIAVKK
jgi:hypothetical protein